VTQCGATFLITGVQGAFGRAFAERALHAGHRVVGTVRRPDAIPAFEGRVSGRAVAPILAITHNGRRPMAHELAKMYFF